MELFLSALGLAMVLEGIPYFVFPNQVKEVARRLPAVANTHIRIFGIAVITLGLAVVYVARQYF